MENVSSENFVAAAVLSEAIIRGLKDSEKHWRTVMVDDESAPMVFLGTIARLEQYRITIIQAMQETIKKPIEELVEMAQKVSDGVVFHNLVSGTISKEDAAAYLGNPQLLDILVSAHELSKKKAQGSEVHTALSDVTSYLSKKRAEDRTGNQTHQKG